MQFEIDSLCAYVAPMMVYYIKAVRSLALISDVWWNGSTFRTSQRNAPVQTQMKALLHVTGCFAVDHGLRKRLHSSFKRN